MNLFTSLSLATALAATASAAAVELEPRAAQAVHLTFHGGPAQYSMAFPADGVKRKTNNNMAVNIIDAPDYNALSQCTFDTPGEKTLVGSISSTGVGQIMVGPPQPITAVRCSGMCVPNYSNCYDSITGQYIGPCCNGYCAATKCRPWVQ